MTDLSSFWDFLWCRPGLGATPSEWMQVLGEGVWDLLRKRLFENDGIAERLIGAEGRSLRVVRMSGRKYGLVDETTGEYAAKGLGEADVRVYRLNLGVLRQMVGDAMGLTTDPDAVSGTARALSLGEWQPVDGVTIPVFMMLPPTTELLASEINRLLLEAASGFVLLLSRRPRLSAALRAQLDRKQAVVVTLPDVVAWENGRFCSAPGWDSHRDAFCQKYLRARMVPAPPAYHFAKSNMWTIRFAGKATYLEGTLKGPVFIRYLLERQGQEIHVARMLADIAGDERLAQASHAGDLIDDKTFRECRQRYDDLQEERYDAERYRPDELPKIDEEITHLANYFAECVGLGGKSRKGADDVAKIRKRIARVIDIACGKIEENDQQLAEHLRKSIKPHQFMSYEPETRIDWNFE